MNGPKLLPRMADWIGAAGERALRAGFPEIPLINDQTSAE
jgi:hypothetical protein